jgi:hypothetical protein
MTFQIPTFLSKPVKNIKEPKTFWNIIVPVIRSLDSVVSIATGDGMDEGGVGVRIPIGARIFSSPLVQTGSGVHPTFYPMGSGGSFLGSTEAGA